MNLVLLGFLIGLALAGVILPPISARRMRNFERRTWDEFARMTRKRARR